MLMVENITALIVFGLWVVGFALGYLLRNWTDEARAEWAETFAYRQRQERKRAAYRRLNNGGR